ncbi:hypothetical protein [Fibrobacter sp. UWEL]|uniref:hypothetical protein n=1 Tax=Fibrobacter sp. UWEL TaxID=1896209 RepID=UPI0009171578|nr:hypothetical protein [Fibrobacter sp. UWEL]SHK64190.1 hypothetical protein SAMN05720468_104144 [Fibrobacter sp. UWEL]
MKIVLVIPPQAATQNQERQGSVLGCFRDGSLLIDGKDGKKPAQFYLTPKDNFPWGQFIEKMLVGWQLANMEDIPPEFRPQKRLPQFVLDGILQETQANQLKILATLRQQGYFSPLPQPKAK